MAVWLEHLTIPQICVELVRAARSKAWANALQITRQTLRAKTQKRDAESRLCVAISAVCTCDLVRAISFDGTRTRQSRRYRSFRHTSKAECSHRFWTSSAARFFRACVLQVLLISINNQLSPCVTRLFSMNILPGIHLFPFFLSHFLLIQLLDKLWSHVSSLLPRGTCLQFLSRIGFSNLTARRLSSNVAN